MNKTLVILTSAILMLLAMQVVAAPVATGDLIELIEPERAAYLRDSVCTQVSSFDRTGGNNDGFEGTYSYIRKEGENFVIFDATGPGCIYRFWSANPNKGWIKFYFDGEEIPRVQFDHWEDMFTDVKYPFVPPLSQHFIGGWASYVPLPFAKSLKIVAQGPVRFLQITWHKFRSPDGVNTFDPNYSQEDRIKFQRVKKAWTNLSEPPTPFSAACQETRLDVTAGPKSTVELAKMDGAGLIRAVRIKADSQDSRFLRKALLLVNVDGQKDPNVYCPLGDFFLDPFGDEDTRSLLTGKTKDGAYYSYWVMPFAKGASIKLRNDSPSPVKLSCEFVYEPLQTLPSGMGRFFAWWHRQNPTIIGQLFPILTANGRGQYCGVSHAMQHPHHGLGFLEGDEMMWIDDRDNTSYNGTGTEDYFNGGWYFGATGSAPLYGCGLLGDGECHAFRFQLTDLVPFQNKAVIGIEHGNNNTVPADYAGVTFWYAAPGTTHTFKPVDVADRMNGSTSEVAVIEAESMLDPKSGGKIIDDTDEPFDLSSGKGVITGSKTGDSFTLLWDTPYADIFTLDLGVVQGPNRGIAEVSVDGQSLGRIDTYSAAVKERMRMGLSPTPKLAKGVHTLTVKSVGRNPASKGSGILVDFVATHSAKVIEGESMEVAKANFQGTDPQNLEGFSQGAHRWFRSNRVGAKVDLRFKVQAGGTYPVSAYLTKAGDYGIIQLKIDDKPIGQPFDGYNDGVTRELVKCGDMHLDSGDHTLTIEVTGKNPKSTNYFAGLDVLYLK